MRYPTHTKEDGTKTERQWNLLGYAVKEGAEGVLMWKSPAAHDEPCVYYDETEVVKDDKPLQVIKERQRKKAQLMRERERALREWHTREEWLEQGRIVLSGSKTMTGNELNRRYSVKEDSPKSFVGCHVQDDKVYRISGRGEYSTMRYSLPTEVETTYYHLDDTRLAENDTELESEREAVNRLRDDELCGILKRREELKAERFDEDA